MPINKNAIIRYQTLDKCFRNPGRRYYFEDLLEECNKALEELNPGTDGVKRRQLFDDIKFMESESGWSVPLERYKDGRKIYYRYSDLDFSINNMPLNEAEAEQLKSALMILSRFKGMPQFAWVEELIPKLEHTFGLNHNSEDIISFDENPYLKGLEFLGTLFNSILYKKVLKIDYQSFRSDETETTIIHPYFLKQYNRRWYLLGKTEGYENLTVRALDRIKKIEEVKKDYIENTQYDFSEYFEDIIGIHRGKDNKPVTVKLWFSPKSAPYVITKPLHGSQKIKSKTSEGLIITISVIPNYELKSLLLSFGNQVKILSPDFLKEELQGMVK